MVRPSCPCVSAFGPEVVSRSAHHQQRSIPHARGVGFGIARAGIAYHHSSRFPLTFQDRAAVSKLARHDCRLSSPPVSPIAGSVSKASALAREAANRGSSLSRRSATGETIRIDRSGKSPENRSGPAQRFCHAVEAIDRVMTGKRPPMRPVRRRNWHAQAAQRMDVARHSQARRQVTRR